MRTSVRVLAIAKRLIEREEILRWSPMATCWAGINWSGHADPRAGLTIAPKQRPRWRSQFELIWMPRARRVFSAAIKATSGGGVLCE